MKLLFSFLFLSGPLAFSQPAGIPDSINCSGDIKGVYNFRIDNLNSKTPRATYHKPNHEFNAITCEYYYGLSDLSCGFGNWCDSSYYFNIPLSALRSVKSSGTKFTFMMEYINPDLWEYQDTRKEEVHAVRVPVTCGN